MSETKKQATLDLSKGVAASALTDGGMILGRVGDQDVVLARSGTELFAIRAHCSHYRGPLAEGLDRRRHRPLSAGTTRVSASAPAKRCARRRSIRLPAGASTGRAT